MFFIFRVQLQLTSYFYSFRVIFIAKDTQRIRLQTIRLRSFVQFQRFTGSMPHCNEIGVLVLLPFDGVIVCCDDVDYFMVIDLYSTFYLFIFFFLTEEEETGGDNQW